MDTILTSIIGVCGTLFGTILGWILNSLSNKGKIYFSDIEINNRYMGLKEDGVSTGYIDNKNKATSYYFTVSLNSYNSSNNFMAIKNIRLEFYNGNKLTVSVVPKDDNTMRKSGVKVITDKASIYNIHPKTIMNYKFSYAFHKDITDIINATKINLIYQNERGKDRTIKLI
ncbi:hypothetical protein KQI61_15355 [Anaerocolumna aminovalerica]|uniref:hypothetical protein n=1 Tax=Anaerocolumna aminovalerica TaxID=1527 RepID=UPI001C0F106C|nr:hypothetical protein [Anaerocolumna aminovalerica]MBU5333575.1 hypothetical protein [Anaerocolumna aminovalerica]